MVSVHMENTPHILLTTDRLILRRVEKEDHKLLELLFCDADIMYYLGGTWSLDQVGETLQEWHNEWGIHNYWCGTVVRRDTAEAVGIAGFTENTNPAEPGLEFSWFIVSEQQKKGFATEITLAILEFAFEHLTSTRVFAETHPENIASSRVLQKLGFLPVGERNHQYDFLPGFTKQMIWEYRRSSWVRKGS